MSRAQTAAAETPDLSQSVVEAVAEIDGTDPLDLSPPLYEAIDLDALDNIFAATQVEDRSEGQVTFFYKEYEVTVYGDGNVSVKENEE